MLEHDLHRMKSEDKLLNIRLTSLTEILSIQETTIAKVCHIHSKQTYLSHMCSRDMLLSLVVVELGRKIPSQLLL